MKTKLALWKTQTKITLDRDYEDHKANKAKKSGGIYTSSKAREYNRKNKGVNTEKECNDSNESVLLIIAPNVSGLNCIVRRE